MHLPLLRHISSSLSMPHSNEHQSSLHRTRNLLVPPRSNGWRANMCYERYKGYSLCSHADPQSTPTESKHCDELLETGVCKMGKQYLLVTSESTPGLCPQCWILLYQLEAAIGANDDSQVGFDTWQLYRRLGWMHKDLLLVVDLVYVIQRAKEQMKNWQGPRHEEQWMLRQWADLFAEFKE
ncbi:hypothetical protein F5Y08DRAFT_202072 [Xylaria arbuscula]|nr:hypothetical protein F5Y08DRAFT_202072 [Xylaria arbuscula]